MLRPQLGLGERDGFVARGGRVGQALQRAVAERVPGAEHSGGGGVDPEVHVGRERREIVTDAQVVGPREAEEGRRRPQGRDGHGLAGLARPTGHHGRRPREPSSKGGVPKPSPVGRSPIRPVRALHSGAMT